MPPDANTGVSGQVGVGIKEGDIQRGGPPPYSLAMHTLSSECYMLAPWYFERRGAH